MGRHKHCMIDDRLAAYGAPEWIWKLCSVLTWYVNIRCLYMCDCQISNIGVLVSISMFRLSNINHWWFAFDFSRSNALTKLLSTNKMRSKKDIEQAQTRTGEYTIE